MISIAVSIWDRHVTAETNVEDTLYLFLVALIAVVVTSGVELAFQTHAARRRYRCARRRPFSRDSQRVGLLLRKGAQWIRLPKKRSSGWACLGTSTLRRALRRSDYSPQYRAQMSGVVALVGSARGYYDCAYPAQF